MIKVFSFSRKFCGGGGGGGGGEKKKFVHKNFWKSARAKPHKKARRSGRDRDTGRSSIVPE